MFRSLVVAILIFVGMGYLCNAKDVGTITLPKKTITVFDVKITAPSATPPAINKFAYAGSNGEVSMSVLASVMPNTATSLADPLIKWTLASIPAGSALTWGKTWPGEATAGQSLSTNFKLTGYPSVNGEFGLRKLKLEGIRKGSAIITKNEDVKFFFEKNTVATGRQVPNWFFYWRQTGASVGAPFYNSTIPGFGRYVPGSSFFYVGDLASGVNPTTSHDGIDTFAETCIHENTHLTDWNNFWPSGYQAIYDLDGDQIPDHLEQGLGFDPALWDTDGDGDYDFEEYAEPRAYAAELTWGRGSADSEDWSSPGHQY